MKPISGLAPADEAALRSIVRKAEALDGHLGHLGGGQRDELASIEWEARKRLDPTFMATLVERAATFFDPLQRDHDWCRKAFEGIDR